MDFQSEHSEPLLQDISGDSHELIEIDDPVLVTVCLVEKLLAELRLTTQRQW